MIEKTQKSLNGRWWCWAVCGAYWSIHSRVSLETCVRISFHYDIVPWIFFIAFFAHDTHISLFIQSIVLLCLSLWVCDTVSGDRNHHKFCLHSDRMRILNITSATYRVCDSTITMTLKCNNVPPWNKNKHFHLLMLKEEEFVESLEWLDLIYTHVTTNDSVVVVTRCVCLFTTFSATKNSPQISKWNLSFTQQRQSSNERIEFPFLWYIISPSPALLQQ